MTTITRSVWETKGAELFGDNKADWRFVCPVCGNAASIATARESFPELKGRGWRPTQECLGRYTPAIDCDWCAYGLFRGPLFVIAPGENGETEVTIPIFDFEGKPFTSEVQS